VGHVKVVWTNAQQQLADGLTKAFSGPKMQEFRKQLGVLK
jgi:hypothetical protein